MTHRRLYCLDVEPLVVDDFHGAEWKRGLPSLCLVDIDAALVTQIGELRDLLDLHHLHAAAQPALHVAWYYTRNGFYHPAAHSLLHVSETAIWLSGWIPPFTRPCFRSSRIPLKEALSPHSPAQPIDLTGVRTAETGGLLRELALLDQEETRTYDRLGALEQLGEQLTAVEAHSAERSNTDLIAYAASLSAEVAQLEHHLTQLALETNTLSKELLRKALGLRLGDWVISIDPRGRRVQLCIDAVHYDDHHLLLSGPLITQQGLVGKRTESLLIPVDPAS